MSEGIAKGMCFRKKRYPSLIKASCVAGKVKAIFGKEQRAYECPICRGFHLTSNPRREQ